MFNSFINFTLLLATLVAAVCGEAPLRSGPYPASGWRPRKPFPLPNEGVPPPTNDEQQPPLDFAGAFASAGQEPQSAYLPPSDDANNSREDEGRNPLLTQGLPGLARPQFFNTKVSSRAPPTTQAQQQELEKQNFKPQIQAKQQQKNFRTQTAQRQQQNFPANAQQTSSGFRPQQQTNFNSQLQPQQQQNSVGQAEQQFFSESTQPKPAPQYGAPVPSSGEINIVYPDPRQVETTADERSYNAIEALNAAIDAYNLAQAQKNAEPNSDGAEDDADNANEEYPTATPYNPTPSRFQQGQYYVLGPDNALQRVIFTTTQDEQEARTKGFTAQLKYMPVGAIQDPVFKYNESGQLVRILRK